MTLAVRLEVPERSAAAVVDLVLDRLNAPTSKATYRRALLDFLRWYQTQSPAAFEKATGQRYRARLLEADVAPPTGRAPIWRSAGHPRPTSSPPYMVHVATLPLPVPP
jgi:hypothetical protein